MDWNANWKKMIVRSNARSLRFREGSKNYGGDDGGGGERRKFVGIPDARLARSARVVRIEINRRRRWRRRGERARWCSRWARVAHSQNEEDVISSWPDGTRETRCTTARHYRDAAHGSTDTRNPPEGAPTHSLLFATRDYSTPTPPPALPARAGESLVFSPPARFLDPPTVPRMQRAILAGERERRRTTSGCNSRWGGSVSVSFCDTGCGILISGEEDPEDRLFARIFWRKFENFWIFKETSGALLLNPEWENSPLTDF